MIRELSHDEMIKCLFYFYQQENLAIKNALFSSEVERIKAFNESKSSHKNAINLLDEYKEKFSMDDSKSSDAVHTKYKEINENIAKFVRNSVRNSVSWIKNWQFRKEYISTIKETADEYRETAKLIKENPNLSEEIKIRNLGELAEKVSLFRNQHLEMTRAKLTKTSVAFSKWFKEKGIGFSELLDIYTNKNFNQNQPIKFAELDEIQKAKVYEDIIAASGRSNLKINSLAKTLSKAGKMLFAVTVVISIWTIMESERPTLEAIQTVVSGGAVFAGGLLGEEIGTALGAAACGGPVGMFFGAILGGIIVGFGAGLAADSLMGALFETANNPEILSQNKNFASHANVVSKIDYPDVEVIIKSIIAREYDKQQLNDGSNCITVSYSPKL